VLAKVCVKAIQVALVTPFSVNKEPAVVTVACCVAAIVVAATPPPCASCGSGAADVRDTRKRRGVRTAERESCIVEIARGGRKVLATSVLSLSPT
jgi:hypothetical protein